MFSSLNNENSETTAIYKSVQIKNVLNSRTPLQVHEQCACKKYSA